MSTAHPLSALLSRSSHLLEHARLLGRLQKQLESLLPADLSAHCRVQNLRNGSLFLQADGPVWANRLRYQLPALQQQLTRLVKQEPLRDIRVAVVPAQAAPHPLKRRATISSESAQLLQETANSTADPQLREALQRLANHAKRG